MASLLLEIAQVLHIWTSSITILAKEIHGEDRVIMVAETMTRGSLNISPMGLKGPTYLLSYLVT